MTANGNTQAASGMTVYEGPDQQFNVRGAPLVYACSDSMKLFSAPVVGAGLWIGVEQAWPMIVLSLLQLVGQSLH